MACVENTGLATAFKHTVNGRSYLEVHHRAPGSKALQILSLKANHPDDAALWLQDMRDQQQVTMHRPVFAHVLCCDITVVSACILPFTSSAWDVSSASTIVCL